MCCGWQGPHQGQCFLRGISATLGVDGSFIFANDVYVVKDLLPKCSDPSTFLPYVQEGACVFVHTTIIWVPNA